MIYDTEIKVNKNENFSKEKTRKSSKSNEKSVSKYSDQGISPNKNEIIKKLNIGWSKTD